MGREEGRGQRQSEFVAVKLTSKDGNAQRFVLERMVLDKLRKKPHFPELVFDGNEDSQLGSGNLDEHRCMFIVMELLGENLSRLRQKLQAGRFSLNTTARIGLQVTDALEELHKLEFIHRFCRNRWKEATGTSSR